MRCPFACLAALACSVACPAVARAQDSGARSNDPARVSGIVRPAELPADPLRAVLDVALFVPREAANLVFLASGSAAGLIQDEQIVPRVAELVSPRPGRIGVFPTAFAETGRPLNVGVRMIANLGTAATTLRAGFGGPNDVVTAGRIRVSRSAPYATTLDLEGSYDRRSRLEYLGVGQTPETDARNRFTERGGPREALYLERRSRTIASLGFRPIDDVELFLSTSLTLRRVEDSPDAGAAALSRVFEPGTVPGAFESTGESYTELGFRLDTRVSRARPSPGMLAATYVGLGSGVLQDDSSFARVGARAAVFWPVIKRSNILSPKVVLDGIVEVGDGELSFAELTRQPEFRGPDTRRDRVSLVGSLDYRWVLMRYVAARVFTDLASVAPNLTDLGLNHLRYAAGFGVDLSSDSTEIGQLAASFSPDGARLMLSLGVASVFGDRQHRD